jgi:hypothetical protein
MGGHEWGPVYLLIRAPLQAIIVFWVYWFTIRQPGAVPQEVGSGGALSSQARN